MTIYGLSQSSGVERRLKVERGGQGIVLTIIDHAADKEQERIMIGAEDLLNAITQPAEGGTAIQGIRPPHGETMRLDLEVRRNEVLLTARGGSGDGSDVAVGLDDLQDALEGAITRE
jgi:hypothetical protein